MDTVNITLIVQQVFMKKLLLASILCSGLVSLQAQNAKPKFSPEQGALLDGRTIVKTNLLGYAFGSYSLSAERLLTRNLSVQLGYSTLPEKSVGALIGLKKISQDYLPEAKLASQSMTVDLRLYLSRNGYGRGFYLQPYYRYEKHQLSDAKIEVKSSAPGATEYYPYNAGLNIKSHSFGLALGTQFALGAKKNIIIDWTIIGVHYGGNINSTLTATSSVPVDAQKVEQYKADIKSLAEDAGFDKDLSFDVSGNGAQINTKFKHPYAFLRSSISVGFRF